MEGDTGKPAQAEAPAPAPGAPAPAPMPAAAEASTAPTTRGWTMFMEAQLPAGQAGSDAPAAESAPAPAPTPAPAAKVGSDAKGWTIFVERPGGVSATAAPASAPAAAAPEWSAPPASAPAPTAAAQAFDDVAVSGRTAVAEEAPARAVQPLSTRTVVMHEPPVIAPPTSPTPYSENRPVIRPNELPAIEDEPKSKTGLIIGVSVIVIVIIVIIAVIAS